MSTFWTQGGSWNQEWFRVPGQTAFTQTQQVTVVARTSENLDLFAIKDGRVMSTFWTQDGHWNQEWFPIPGQTKFDDSRQRVAVVARTSGNLDLFAIRNDDRVMSTFWTA